MKPDDTFANWASLFLTAYEEGTADPASAAQQSRPAVYNGISPAADELLQSIDAGGVPAFVTANLLEIAAENGIEAADDWSPNQIIEAIRAKASSTPSPELSD